MHEPERYGRSCDLVLEGGGIKGVALAGGWSVLEEHGFAARRVAGTSAGAITGALVAAGYSAGDIRDIVLSMNFLELRDRGWEDRIPLVPLTVAILKDLGLYEGNRLEAWIRDLLAQRGVRTFADLPAGDRSADPRYRSRLQVTATDVTSNRLLVLPRDAAELGLDPDRLEVARAVRMSMSIPIFFEPVSLVNERTKHAHVVVDGAVLSNFPVWLFDSEDRKDPAWPTFGLFAVDPDPKSPIGQRLPAPERGRRGAGDFVRYAKAMADALMEAHDRMYVREEDFARTIAIPTLGMATTAFDITYDDKAALYQSGRDAAARFLETWDFAGYVAAFRRGDADHGRRRTLAERMRRAAEESAGSEAPAPAAD
jgi:NTE family protein